MTRKKLKSLYYLEREVRMWERKLKDVEGDREQERIYKQNIRRLLARAQSNRKEIYDFIETIDDSYKRMLINLRCVEHKTWEEITDELGGSSGSHKKYYQRYIATIRSPRQ